MKLYANNRISDILHNYRCKFSTCRLYTSMLPGSLNVPTIFIFCALFSCVSRFTSISDWANWASNSLIRDSNTMFGPDNTLRSRLSFDTLRYSKSLLPLSDESDRCKPFLACSVSVSFSDMTSFTFSRILFNSPCYVIKGNWEYARSFCSTSECVFKFTTYPTELRFTLQLFNVSLLLLDELDELRRCLARSCDPERTTILSSMQAGNGFGWFDNGVGAARAIIQIRMRWIVSPNAVVSRHRARWHIFGYFW